MYTNEDLNIAVKAGIFSQASVDTFRDHIAEQKNVPSVDEENFRLIGGFNDIFVIIASGLLLASITLVATSFAPIAGPVALSVASWFLAEFFVRKRRMALPAIGLLLTFLGGVFTAPIAFNGQPSELIFAVSGILTAIAALAHWQRFKVPITVAAGTAAALACIVAGALYLLPILQLHLMPLLFFSGLITFALAMKWDASDRLRQTRKSDVAFWLHLVAAPMIVHPIFSALGILQGIDSVLGGAIIISLYILLAMVSIAVDRRAIMVSALVYVIYAFSSVLETYGVVSYSFAVTGICIGASLLLLSAFWHNSRRSVLKLIPHSVKMHLPALH